MNKVLRVGAFLIPVLCMVYSVVASVQINRSMDLVDVTRVYTHVGATVEPVVKIAVLNELELINNTRVEKGLGVLAVKEALNQSASDKCKHMVENDYWAHNAPDGTTPWYFIEKYNGFYLRAGEILARNYLGKEAQHQGWLNSPLHYNEIVGDYRYFGSGMCNYENGSSLTVVHFLK